MTSVAGTRTLAAAGAAQVLVDLALPGLYPVSLEILHEHLLIDPGGDPDRIQFRPVTFHLATGAVSYISHGGFEFDGSDQGAFPGLDCAHDRHGQLLAIRVARARFNTTRT
ncbi:MAG: hypothetical protein J0H98_07145 [Solirubrobacterales bacterium]|nr:hypothetical protein [Solirubrobacterales bacterium]